MGEIGVTLMDPDHFALDVLNDILNSFGGKLFDEIRSREVGATAPRLKAQMASECPGIEAMVELDYLIDLWLGRGLAVSILHRSQHCLRSASLASARH
jgi:hypothetical protein